MFIAMSLIVRVFKVLRVSLEWEQYKAPGVKALRLVFADEASEI